MSPQRRMIASILVKTDRYVRLAHEHVWWYRLKRQGKSSTWNSLIGRPLLVETFQTHSSIWRACEWRRKGHDDTWEWLFSPFHSAISTCQHLLLVSNVENIVASQCKAIQSCMPGIGYEARIVTAFNLHWSTIKRRIRPCWVLGKKTISEAHSVRVGSITSMASICFIFCISNSLALGPA